MCIALCTARIALKACDLMQLQERRRVGGSLPSDGSGIDPHATQLVVQPVAQTGQRCAENGGGARGCPAVPSQSHTKGYPSDAAQPPLCPVTSSRSRCPLAASLFRRLLPVHRELADRCFGSDATLLGCSDGRSTAWSLMSITGAQGLLV